MSEAGKSGYHSNTPSSSYAKVSASSMDTQGANHNLLKREYVDHAGDSGDLSPTKKTRVTTTDKPHSPLKAVISVCTANQTATITSPVMVTDTLEKNQPSVTPVYQNPYVTTSTSVAHTSSAVSKNPVIQAALASKPTSSPVVAVRSPPQTRTLAQIRSLQNVARAQSQCQTRTLAQIKAETKARVQMRNQQARNARQVPNILQAKNKAAMKAVSQTPLPDAPETTEDGVKLRRSLQICQDVITKSGANQFQIDTDLKVKSIVTCSDATKTIKTETVATSNQTAHTVVKPLCTSSVASSLPSIAGLLSASNNPIHAVNPQQQLVPLQTQVSNPVNSRIISGPGNTKFLVPSVVPNSTVGTSNIVRILNSAPANQIATSQILPSRASSAPPHNILNVSASENQVTGLVRSASAGLHSAVSENQVTGLIRSASAGLHSSAQQPTPQPMLQSRLPPSTDIQLNISPEQLHFLSKSGTATPPGSNGSQHAIQAAMSSAASGNVGRIASPSLAKVVVCSAADLVNQIARETQMARTPLTQASVVTVPAPSGGTTKARHPCINVDRYTNRGRELRL